MKNETTHTPGPWYEERPYGEPGLYIASVEDSSLVARIMGNDADKNTTANARLISAAPELLEALKHALDVMEIHEVGKGCRTQQVAREAIAKAEGAES